MFERYTERARRVLFFARVRGQPARERLHRDRTPAARPDPGGQGPHQPDLRALQRRARLDPQGDRGAHRVPREGVDVGRDPLQRRDQARAAVRRRGGRPAGPHLHRHRAPAARHPARGAVAGRVHPHGEGHAAGHRPRRRRVAAQREERRAAEAERDAAAGRVQPRPDRRRLQEARSTRWSAATRRSSASSRCCAAARRTTPCSSASPASARRRLSKGSPSGSSPATCRTTSPTSGSSRSTSRSWSPARSTAGSSRSASRRS